MKQGILSVVFLPLILVNFAKASPLEVFDLRTEFQTEATGVSSTPRLSWKLKSDQRAKSQSHYHILAASSPEKLTLKEADLWNSQLQKKHLKHLIPWQGKALQDGQKVHWKVKIHDEKGKEQEWSSPTHFTVGTQKSFKKPKRISSFKSSSDHLNSLFDESIKALQARLALNLKEGPIDLGLGIDLQRSARALLYHFDSIPLLSEWIHQMDQSRSEEGFFPVKPGSKDLGNLSSESGITVNHPLWWMSGDHELPKKRWTYFEKHMMARENADLLFKGSTWGGLKESEGVPPAYLDLCHLGTATRLTRELALPAQQPLNVIRFQDYAGRIRKNFERRFIKEDGTLKHSSQTAQLLALRSAVLRKEQQKKIIDNLLHSLDQNGPQVGPIGAHLLPSVLSLTQNQDKAVQLLSELNDEQKKAFLGNGLSEWFMSFLAGIDASSAGFANIRITPRIPSGDSLIWVEASHHSVVGEIKTRWEKLENGALKVDFTIPPGSLARISLPCEEGQSVSEGGLPLNEAFGIEKASQDGSVINLVSHSGTYSVLIK